jgi:hypothetical protein
LPVPDYTPQTVATREAELNAPPLHTEWHEAARQRHTRDRLAVLSGVWKSILVDRILATVGADRFSAMPDPSLATNPFSAICRQLACLYDQGPPSVTNPVAEARGFDVAGLTRTITRAGYWARMQAQQRLVLGLREVLVHVAIDEGRPLFLFATPDQVVARARPERPDQPVRIEWLRKARVDVAGAVAGTPAVPELRREQWTLWVWDVADPEAPYHRVYALGQGQWRSSGMGAAAEVSGIDVTEQLLGGRFDGDAYPFRRRPTLREERRAAELGVPAVGVPILPWVVYHAAPNGASIFSAYDEIELFDGTLDVAAKQGFVDHAFLDASWPQRYVIGAVPVGGSVHPDDAGHVAHVPTDPASVLILQKLQDYDGQPMIGQYQAGADPAALQGVVSGQIEALATNAGVAPSDVQRLGGTARSGVAIALSQGGKRDMQRRYAPVFRDADERLVALVATLWNRWSESPEGLAVFGEEAPPAYPESGYEVHYQSLPLSPAEREARRKDVLERLAAGLVSRVDAYAELHDVSREEAAVRLAAMDGPDGDDDDDDADDLREELVAALAALEGALGVDGLPRAAREALEDARDQARAAVEG